MSAFPAFLAPAFERDSLEQLDSSLAVIDQTGAILWVNQAWDRFASENGADPHEILQRSYFDGISPPLRLFFEAVFANALVTDQVFEHEYECSSPDVRRIFHLRALPIAGHALVLDHSLRVEAPHERATGTTEERYFNDAGFVVQCSNCRRVRRRDEQAWDWVKAWVARPHPKTSHGLCPSCVAYYWGHRRSPEEKAR